MTIVLLHPAAQAGRRAENQDVGTETGFEELMSGLEVWGTNWTWRPPAGNIGPVTNYRKGPGKGQHKPSGGAEKESGTTWHI